MIKLQGRVVQKVDNTIQRIAWFVLLTLIHWKAIYPVADSVIQPLNNRGLSCSYHFNRNSLSTDPLFGFSSPISQAERNITPAREIHALERKGVGLRKDQDNRNIRE